MTAMDIVSNFVVPLALTLPAFAEYVPTRIVSKFSTFNDIVVGLGAASGDNMFAHVDDRTIARGVASTIAPPENGLIP